tara:strand:- start:53 stop:400 length:348 start_codon:yes stop_codon:yes gene_type:complete
MTNKYNVTIIPPTGAITKHIVEGEDGPNFADMYKLLDCNMIEITGARVNGTNYDMYIDEEGRLKTNDENPAASQYFINWLSNEGRVARIANVVGTAALVDPNPIGVEHDKSKESI